MCYEAETIANAFLKIAEEDGYSLTPMKLQKLLYFAQGHSLSLLDKSLIRDDCQCWPYGPVYPHVYTALRCYGSNMIEAPIVDKSKCERFDLRQINDKDFSFLRSIWKRYRRFDAFYLSELTHVPNGPWANTVATVHSNERPVIGKTLIRDFFNSLKKKRDGIS